MEHFPIPKNQNNIRQFLGLSRYYRRFIENYSKIAKPLTTLLKDGVEFVWTRETQKSFDKLKTLLCTAPILQYPDLDKDYIITTDASGYAIGGVLSQGEVGKDKPIAYFSRALRGAELNYSTYEKEALAILESVTNFRTYVYNAKFTVVTDHEALKWFSNPVNNNNRICKCRLKLSQYNFNIIYKPGKLNSNADALSRNPVEDPETTGQSNQINVVTRNQAKNINKTQENNTTTNNQESNSIIIEQNVDTKEKKKRSRPKKKQVEPPPIPK